MAARFPPRLACGTFSEVGRDYVRMWSRPELINNRARSDKHPRAFGEFCVLSLPLYGRVAQAGVDGQRWALATDHRDGQRHRQGHIRRA